MVGPRFNIAPTQKLIVIRADESGGRNAAEMRWGLIPAWGDDLSLGNRAINARSETVAEKPTFRSALKKRRCLIPADGYFEWQTTGKAKQPYLFHRPDHHPFALAGLWETNARLGGSTPLLTCTVLTTMGNTITSPFHERMPVILPPEAWTTWLDPRYQDVLSLKPWFVPAPDEFLVVTKVSTVVNNPRHDRPECVQLCE
jgi:putative SOS response-associated peptidase YedK